MASRWGELEGNVIRLFAYSVTQASAADTGENHEKVFALTVVSLISYWISSSAMPTTVGN
jgi:hypothetical protein